MQKSIPTASISCNYLHGHHDERPTSPSSNCMGAKIKKIFLVRDGRALFLDKVSCNECPMMIIGWPVGEKKAKGTDAKVSQMFRLQKYQLL